MAVLASPLEPTEPLLPIVFLSPVSSKVALAGSLLISLVTLRMSSYLRLGQLLRQNSM